LSATSAVIRRIDLKDEHKMTTLRSIGIFTIVLAAASLPASAATVGYSITIGTGGALNGTFDYPAFTLTNLSDPGTSISSINFTIGDPTFNFDRVTNSIAPAGGTMVRTIGDNANGGPRTDLFAFDFSGFDAGDFATWRAEIDPDSFNAARDFRSVFFNNGGIVVPNSLVSVLFSDGFMLDLTLVDTGSASSYTFSASHETVSAVPIPATLPLLAGAFGLLGLARLRSGRATA
jgi:hypothetical protein